MYKLYSKSVPQMVLTAVLTTSILAACTPTKQPGESRSQIDIFPVYEEDTVITVEKKNIPDDAITSLPASITKDSIRKNYTEKSKQRPHRMESTSLYSGGVMPQAMPSIRAPGEAVERENYNHFDDNKIKLVAESPVSTFSIDVDTGSYSNIRRMINSGQLPREDAVRVEELINYFSYTYPLPEAKKTPFSVTTEMGVTPWNSGSRLLHIGIKGYDVEHAELPASNLVFLVDVSGSMNSPEKLGLLKSALKLLTKQMRAEDKISIVVYAGASGVVLEPTAANKSATIVRALDSLSAGGSTNGAAGIRSAYQLAEQAFIKDGINRVILATDGDFNVGTVNFEALKDLIEEKRKTGISLTTLGFGTGNYNDHLMEQLADAGNGNYSYIDTLNEAQKVLVDEMSSTLNIIAKDVKIQLEFNPAVVAEYRLIGYENRALNREDFNNDNIDAGEIGAGHSVTALYEVTLADSEHRAIDPLRYDRQVASDDSYSDELAYLRLRYKEPDANNSKLIEQVVKTSEIKTRIADTSDRYRFSASVASFGQILRGGKYTGEFDYDDILTLARSSRGKDSFGYRGEFISIVNLARSLSSNTKVEIQASR